MSGMSLNDEGHFVGNGSCQMKPHVEIKEGKGTSRIRSGKLS